MTIHDLVLYVSTKEKVYWKKGTWSIHEMEKTKEFLHTWIALDSDSDNCFDLLGNHYKRCTSLNNPLDNQDKKEFQ